MPNLFRFFKFDEEKALAARLATHIEKNLPPKLMGDRRHILSANKITRILEQAYEQVQEHKAKSRPGFVKRAVLVNDLKWQLQTKGFPSDFVSVAIEALIVALSRKAPTKLKRP